MTWDGIVMVVWDIICGGEGEGSCTHVIILVLQCRVQILRLSLEGVAAGLSPDINVQSHSLPSSVTDTLEAMVGGGLDDLTLEDIDPANLTEEQPEVL